MKKKLNLLEELQSIDLTIDEKKALQAELNAGVLKLEQSLASAQVSLAEHQAQMAELRNERAGLDVALHTEQENIKRSETNMKEIRTNKEFQAIGREITAARKQVSDLEEQQLQLETRCEELQVTIDACQAELNTLADSVQNNNTENKKAIDSLQATIDEATTKRDTIIKELASSRGRRYTQLRDQRNGRALAEARDGSCVGCNMQLPPQLYNMLFRGDEMHFCPHCQRILVLKTEQPAEEAAA